ncbi:transcriptional repressor [Diplodia seriata]|uniref:Transcriptional repressor n=1 Tax=Diplodia seriata TaxID=420778 RepID=A0ABR3CKG0_9PEZI
MSPTIPPDPLRQHRCPYCPRYFTTTSELARHEKIHTVQKGFHCPKPDSDKAYPNVGQLNDHLKKSHAKLKCPVCKRELAKPETFERHVRKSHGGDYPADSNFDKLLASLEGKSRKYQCPQCDRSYDVQDTLRQHIRGTHPTDEERAAAPEFKCPICGAEFRKKADYRQHLKNIHQLDINKAGDLIKAAEKASKSDQISKAPPSQPVAQSVAQNPKQKKLTSFFGNDSQPSSSSTKKLPTLPPQMPVAGPTTAILPTCTDATIHSTLSHPTASDACSGISAILLTCADAISIGTIFF